MKLSSRILFIAVLLVRSMSAGTVTLAALTSGHYDDLGGHTASSQNYVAGRQLTNTTHGFTEFFRNFFVFDLIGFQGDITSATLRLFMPSSGYDSTDPSETFALYPVATPISTLTADHSPELGNSLAPAVFGDLGSALVLGVASITASSQGGIVQITLNSDGIDYLNFKRGNRFALGGALTSIAGNVEMVFASSNQDDLVRELVINYDAPSIFLPKEELPEIPWPGDSPGRTDAPEPGTWGIMAAGLAGLLGWASRNRRNLSRGACVVESGPVAVSCAREALTGQEACPTCVRRGLAPRGPALPVFVILRMRAGIPGISGLVRAPARVEGAIARSCRASGPGAAAGRPQ